MREGKRSVAALYKELALQHNRSDLLTVLSEYERVRVNDYVGLGFVGEVEEWTSEHFVRTRGMSLATGMEPCNEARLTWS
jgi:hypothetical protein